MDLAPRNDFEPLGDGLKERLNILLQVFVSGKQVLSRTFLETLAARIVELSMGEPLPGVALQATPPHSDLVDRFLLECCEMGTSFQVGTTELNDAMRDWCAEQGKFPPTKRAVAMRLEQHGLLNTRQTAGKRFWVGLRLKQCPVSRDE